VAREGQSLDPEHRRTVGSARGIVSQDLARKGLRIWAWGSRGCKNAISRQLEAVWAIAEREWNTGGTKPLGSRCEKPQGIGIRSREAPRSEVRMDTWQSIRWDRTSRGLMN
jgi:hypothetical protein